MGIKITVHELLVECVLVGVLVELWVGPFFLGYSAKNKVDEQSSTFEVRESNWGHDQ